MTEVDSQHGGLHDPTEEDSVAELIRFAGPSPTVSPEALAQLRRETRRHWQGKVVATRQRRHMAQRRWLAVAAALVVSIGATYLWSGRGPSTPPVTVAAVASLESVFGGTWAVPDGGLVPGAALATDPGVRVALRLADGASLRLDGASRVVLDGATAVTLERGGVYLDSGEGVGATAAPSLEVRTPFGLARDIGTQFEVRVDADSLEVRVRQGEVQVETPEASHGALAGGYLRISADGSVQRRQEAVHGGPWSGVQEAAPALDLEGKSLAEALRWMGRETGWQVAFADAALAEKVEGIIIHGAVQDLRPTEVPEVLLPSSCLQSQLRQGTLHVCSEAQDCASP